MPVIYRTAGAWGPGKGANLEPAEVDGNFFDIATRVDFIEDNPPAAVVPIAMSIEGSALTIGLSNGDVLGPVTITMPMPEWRGDWQPSTPYAEMDFVVAPDNSLVAVLIPHTSAAMFDLAGLASNASFDAAQSTELLNAYFPKGPSDDVRMSHAGMQCASLLREALWSLVSVSHLDRPGVDYAAYAHENFLKLESSLEAFRNRFGKPAA